MSLASGSRVKISYVKEQEQGVTPVAPTMKTLRVTQRNINLEKDMLTSAEVRTDRNVSDMRHGFNRVGGTLGYELSRAAFDDLLEGALGGTWKAVSVAGGPDLGADADATMFTRSAGSFITDGFRPGDIIETSGFAEAENNGQFRVLAVAATEITVDGTLKDEVEASARTLALKGARLDIGVNLYTYTVERLFEDLQRYQVFRGVAVNTFSLSVQPGEIVGGTFDLVGMSADPMSSVSLGTPSAPPANSPFSAFDGRLYEGGAQIAVATGFDLNLDNGRVLEPVVGSPFSPAVFDGTANITGTSTLFFENETMFNKFVNETDSSLWLKLNDINGTDFMNIVVPRLKYTGGTMDPPQQGPVPLEMPFTALFDANSGTSLSIQRSNALE